MEFSHIPVLLSEVLENLNIKEDGIYVDCTIGGGGHSSQILKRLTSGHLYGFDRDEMALSACQNRFKTVKNVTLIKDNYENAAQRLIELGVTQVDGILMDLGVSSPQIDLPERGFSILHDGKLDMRMDQSQELDAAEVVNNYSKEQLLKILYEYGEEPNAKNIVSKIIAAREIKPIETTFELKEIIESAFPKKLLYKRGNVSQQTFQALRIEVNGELVGLEKSILQLVGLLKSGAVMEVISFHSLEDRIVKNTFKQLATDCICPPKTPVCICGHKAEVKLVTHKPITAQKAELESNNRSRSAKLRVVQKL